MIDEIGELQIAAEKLDVDDRAGLDDLLMPVDGGEAVGAAEGGDAAGPLAHRVGRRAYGPPSALVVFYPGIWTSPTSRYSVRPISLFTFTASRACTTVRSSASRPASRRSTGATNS